MTVKFYTNKFERSHGRKPKPGYGMWGWIVMDESCNKEVEIIWTTGNMAEARKEAASIINTKYAEQIADGMVSVEVAP